MLGQSPLTRHYNSSLNIANVYFPSCERPVSTLVPETRAKQYTTAPLQAPPPNPSITLTFPHAGWDVFRIRVEARGSQTGNAK